MMKAAVVEKPGRLVVKDVPDPNMGEYDALCEILCGGTFTYYQGGYDEEEAHQRIVSFVRKGALDASLWMDLENPFPLEDIKAAFEFLRERKGVKALIQVKA